MYRVAALLFFIFACLPVAVTEETDGGPGDPSVLETGHPETVRLLHYFVNALGTGVIQLPQKDEETEEEPDPLSLAANTLTIRILSERLEALNPGWEELADGPLTAAQGARFGAR